MGSDISYRALELADYDDVKSMINEVFSIDRYATAPHLLKSALSIYLHQCLSVSTYTQVAVRDGEAIGILMGRVKGQPFLPGRLRHRLTTSVHMLKIALTGFKERKTLLQYFSFEKAYGQLRKRISGPLSDELTLFAVDASTRGTGVGTTLYENYMAYLRDKGRSDFYLYTDSLCTYEFYEKRGMVRSAEQDITLDLGDGPQPVGVYIYSGTAF